MKKLIEDFNAEHAGSVKIDATTLDWGVPFYAKVQTSAAVGEAPDVMTYHASRIPLAVSQGILDEITADDWSKMGLRRGRLRTGHLGRGDRRRQAVCGAARYPPDRAVLQQGPAREAGVLGDDGRPKGMDSREGFTATLQALKDAGVEFPLGSVTADGNFMFRTIYSLVCQQGGELMTGDEFLAGDNGEKLANALGVLQDWTNDGPAVDLHRLPRDRRALHLWSSGDDDQRRLGGPDNDRPRRPGKAIRVGRRRDPGDLR